MRSYLVRMSVMLLLAIMLIGCTDSENRSGDVETNDGVVTTPDGGLLLPAIKLPKGASSASMDMIGLIVYKGKIYTQTATSIDAARAAELVGEKLGRTVGGIDEWSKQDDYATELASSIGEADVFEVKGYDSAFRVMTYQVVDGQVYAEFYECLNGITVYTGADVFGQLRLTGHVVETQSRTHSDWYNSVENYRLFEDMELLQLFVEELNLAVPVPRESAVAELGDFRNNEWYRELSLLLKDGSLVRMVVIKDGYVRYGNADVYFKMDSEIFGRVWEEMTKESEEGHDGQEEVSGDREVEPISGDVERSEQTAEQAEAIMSLFLDLLKTRDAEGLLMFLKRSEFFSYFTLDLALKVIEGYERNFDLASLYVNMDEESNSHSPEHQQYGFILSDSAHAPESQNGIDQIRGATLRYELESGQPIVYTPYVRYYPYAEAMVVEYMRLIAEDLPAELASFMNADDSDIPVWVGEDTIKAYSELLDLSNITINNDRGFIYTISDSHGASHTIEVIYGDGLMGIRDDLIPDFQS